MAITLLVVQRARILDGEVCGPDQVEYVFDLPFFV